MDRDDHPAAGRPFPRRDLRQASLVLPDTGERVKRRFTLRNFANSATTDSSINDQASYEHTPLLPTPSSKPNPVSWIQHSYTWAQQAWLRARHWIMDFILSRDGQGVLKCSLAYLLATMAVFLSFFTKILGSGDGKHLVANIIVWFHPARSGGSMDKGSLYALIAFIYAAAVCYICMGIVTFFRVHDLLNVGHVVVLVIGCCGGLGLIAWVKQRNTDLLVNLSCSLAAIPVVTMLTKDRATQDGYFSHNNVSQVLRMMMMALVISILVNQYVRPISARQDLRGNLIKFTDAFADLLSGITSSFISGSDEDMKHPIVAAAFDTYDSVYTTLDQNLTEARYEHYFRGTVTEYCIEASLVECMQHLAQDIGGLRSAASIQFSLLAASEARGEPTPITPAAIAPVKNPSVFAKDSSQSAPSTLQTLHQSREQAVEDSSSASTVTDQPRSPAPFQRDLSMSVQGGPSTASTANVFAVFIENLGPPMKSLAFTLKEILNELPFGPAPKYHSRLNPNFKTSLVSAIDLFSSSRKEALVLVYKSKAISKANSVQIAADFEEVAASCGHFSSSLQDLAENCVTYLDTLELLENEVQHRGWKRSWWWLCSWRRSKLENSDGVEAGRKSESEHQDASFPVDMPSLGTRRFHQSLKRSDRPEDLQTFRYRFWRALRFFRRDDIKFAVKVGVGAIALAVWAYVPATQETFLRWRFEWALNVYMFVCAMTIGAANTTVYPRMKGTTIGAAVAVVVWIVAQGNAWVLAFLGWCVSVGGFYMMLIWNQGPLSRFFLLSYNLSVLYSYSLSINDVDHDLDDPGGVDPAIWRIVFHRLVAVSIGIMCGLFVTQAIWPISARRKLKSGLSLLWLRMGMIWKRAPLSILIEGESRPPSYMDIREELKLRQFADFLDIQRKSAESEFILRGPFPTDSYKSLLKSTTRMLDGFHALNVILMKDLKASMGEREILKFTTTEREQLARRISHLFSVLASSVKLEYPLNDALPQIGHTRDRLLARVFAFRQNEVQSAAATDEDYELLYAYALVTAQIAKEIDVSGKVIEELYGVLNEDIFYLQ